MKNIRAIAILFAIIGLNISYSQDSKNLPSIDVENLGGEKAPFNGYIKPGKNYVVSFWATWCVPCKKELSNIEDLYDNWKEELNTEVIAISGDDSRNRSRVKAYVEGEEWPYTVLLDPNQDLMRAMGVQNMPFTFIINSKGEIVYKHNSYVEGDEYEIENKLMELKQGE